MKRLWFIAGLALVWFVAPATAQNLTACQVAAGTVSASGTVPLQCDTSGNLKTVGGSGAAPTPVSGTGGVSSVTVGTSASTVSAAATRTARLSVTNVSSTAILSCTLGATTPVSGAAGTFTVGPRQILSFANDAYVPADQLQCISDTTSTPATVWSK